LDYYYLGIKRDRRKKWREAVKIVIVAVLIILVIGSVVALVANVFDIQVPVFNPSPPIVWRYFELDYPQNSPQGPSLRIFVNLTTSGNFVQGQTITMYVSGTIRNELLQNLTSVYPYGYQPNSTNPLYQAVSNDSGITVGFAGAPLSVSAIPLFPFLANPSFPITELNPSQYSPTGTAVELVVNATNPHVPIFVSLGTNISALTQIVVWTAQGDYHPEVSFFTGNIIVNNTKNNDQIYDSIVIHIDSSETLQSARYNRIDEVVSIVLIIFVLVEASKLIWEILKKD